METLISVVVPVYNTKKYLEKCVDSILNQTYKNLEVLLIDDGSFDGTEFLCDTMATKDCRVKVFHIKNGGTSRARNIGISAAQGDFIGFVDSDDYIDLNMYDTLISAVNQFDCKIAQVARDEFQENGARLPDICVPPVQACFIDHREFRKELLMHRGDCSFCTKIVAKELLSQYKFPEGVLNEDFNLILRLLEEVDGIASMPLQGYHVLYRLGSNTRIKKGFSRVFWDNIVNADMVYELVKNKYPELLTIAIRFGFVQRLDYLLHIPIDEMNSDNSRYHEVVAYIRTNTKKLLLNKYITTKQKVYLCLLGWMPKFTRKVHGFTMKIRKG